MWDLTEHGKKLGLYVKSHRSPSCEKWSDETSFMVLKLSPGSCVEERLKESKCGARESSPGGAGWAGWAGVGWGGLPQNPKGLLVVIGVVRSREKFWMHSEGRALALAGEWSGDVRERTISSVTDGGFGAWVTGQLTEIG